MLKSPGWRTRAFLLLVIANQSLRAHQREIEIKLQHEPHMKNSKGPPIIQNGGSTRVNCHFYLAHSEGLEPRIPKLQVPVKPLELLQNADRYVLG
jgi:hypothetical protein